MNLLNNQFMNFSIDKNNLYQPLQKIINIISNKPKLPILGYILLKIDKNYLFMTATNLEIEITAKILLHKTYPTESIMISGRKFFEICRTLPEQSKISIILKNNKILINSGNSNFCLSTVAIKDFPTPQKSQDQYDNIIISQLIFKKMIKLTHFAMAHQDSRYYLNGIFFKTSKNSIRMVATDGYRLAMSEIIIEDALLMPKSIIIPRKSILEILNLLNTNQDKLQISIHNHYIHIQIGQYTFNSQLIEATFPNYLNVFPKEPKNILEIDRIILKNALRRASILSHIKHRIVNLDLTMNQLKITTYNFDQDTSEETLKISYSNENIQISFNVDYLLDVINAIDSQNLKFYILNATSSIQIEGIPKCFGSTYIVMPIKI